MGTKSPCIVYVACRNGSIQRLKRTSRGMRTQILESYCTLGTFSLGPLQAESFWIARLGLGQGRILLKLFGQKYLIDGSQGGGGLSKMDCLSLRRFPHPPPYTPPPPAH